MTNQFRQVDVFGKAPLLGNPLAVVHDADAWGSQRMAAYASWTNLSETVFLSTPTHADADYRVRIFTIAGELPFAGHPTLGAAHAWLEAGGMPARPDRVVQECGVGLVEVARGDRLAFAAPPLLRQGRVEPDVQRRVGGALGVGPGDVVDMAWVDNGPGWVGVQLTDATTVLGLDPDPSGMRGLKVGVLGRHGNDGPPGVDVEVRAFYSDGRDVGEDPVTGSANAGLAQWLIGAGRLPSSYVARQGTVLRRDGRIHVDGADGEIWVGGATRTVITGIVRTE